jgi:hypothetical protein
VLPFGSAVQLNPWKVPQLTPATLNGTLVGRDGVPASRTGVAAWDATDDPRKTLTRRAGQTTTDENGHFSLKVWEAQIYALTASPPGLSGRIPTDVTRLSVTAGMPPVRVTIVSDRQRP